MKKIIILITLSLLLFFTACDGEGLIYTIETEELVDDNNLENIKFTDTVVTNDYYYALGKYIWYQDADGGDWSRIDSSLDSLSSMVLFNGTVYYTGRIGSSAYVYTIDESGTSPVESSTAVCEITTSYDYVWLQLFSSGTDPDSTSDVMYLNQVEYEYDDDDDPYVENSLLFYTDGSDIEGDFDDDTATYLEIVDDDDGDYWPIQSEGMAFNVSGGEAWLIFNDIDPDEDPEEGGTLWYSTDNFSTATDMSSADADDDDDYDYDIADYNHYYHAIYYADISSGGTYSYNYLLISSRSDWSATDTSLLYASNDYDGDSWVTWYENDEDDDCDNLYSCFVYNDKVSDYIIASTRSDYYIDADGYVLIDISDDDPSSLSIGSDDDDMADEDNYESSDLEDSSVYSMTFDTNNSDFALVAGTSTGVWTFDSSDLEWTQE
ncbi:MAG: hypothetical protein PQJ59_15120 [Spirochaetales bacterium]|nr:hypothetical protein [Spirochaetales bacterium]